MNKSDLKFIIMAKIYYSKITKLLQLILLEDCENLGENLWLSASGSLLKFNNRQYCYVMFFASFSKFYTPMKVPTRNNQMFKFFY